MAPSSIRAAVAALALTVTLGCVTDAPAVPVPIAATALALDATTVEIQFTRALDPASPREGVRVFAALDGAPLALDEVRVEGEVLRLRTAPQTGGALYAVRLDGLAFAGIALADAPGQVSFVGFGTTRVSLSLDTRGSVVSGALSALVTLDPSTGRYSERFQPVPLSDTDGDLVYTATVSAQIEPARVYAARAVAADGAEAGALATFTATSARPVRVVLESRLPAVPEFEAPLDPQAGDGLARIRVILDDRYARALASPALRSSLDPSGAFDISTQRVDAFRPVADKPRVYELLLDVQVDPARKPDGTTAADFPYVAFLVEKGEDVPERGLSFVAPDETPQVVVIPVGNPAMVPVTFRVDVGSALLEPDPDGPRGVYPGEGVFLTGEFPASEDALGRLAADAFSGGERATLEMQPRPDVPTIYEKTVFMNPNRPYGWKVVRCPTGVGCAELNRRVTSSGRAFPTVMKNLVTANTDAAGDPSVVVVDPAALDRVPAPGGGTTDYSAARVSTTGEDSPGPTTLFKQEVPDLVVMVGTEPLITPIHVVGTWRDVNIPTRPSEIISSGQNIELGMFDYDDGLVGRAPLVRDVQLPLDPGIPRRPAGEPVFDATDGRVDASARQLSAPGRLPLWIAWNERSLYVATQAAPAGRDHFVIVSLDPPQGGLPAQWAKGGRSAGGDRTVFLAMEGDGDFSGWFRRGAMGNDDTLLEGLGLESGRGEVLEGAIELDRAGLGAPGAEIWVAVVAYGTRDGDPLGPDLQNPAGDGDFDLDADELQTLTLVGLRAP